MPAARHAAASGNHNTTRGTHADANRSRDNRDGNGGSGRVKPSLGGGKETLAPGALVVLYTDGIVEARSHTGEQFGLDKLKGLLLDHREAPATEVTRVLNEAIAVWCRGSTFTRDDIAIVGVRVST